MRFPPSIYFNLAALLILGVVTFYGLRNWEADIATDFTNAWIPGQASRIFPVDDIYSLQNRQTLVAYTPDWARREGFKRCNISYVGAEGFEFTATPFLYALLAEASTGNFDRDYFNFRTACTLAFIAAFIYFAWAFGYPLMMTACLMAFFAHCYWPLLMDIYVSNINRIQLLALAVIVALLALQEWPWEILTGFVYGLAAAAKPNLIYIAVLLFVHWGVRKRWVRLGNFALGLLPAVFFAWWLPHRYFGPTCTWNQWLTEHPQILYTDWYLTGGVLGKLTGTKNMLFFSVYGISFLAATAAAVAMMSRSSLNHWQTEIALMGLGVSVYILSGPIVHSHYFTLLIPWWLFVMRRFWRWRSSWGRTAWGLAALFLLSSHPLFSLWGLTQAPNHSLLTFAGAAILFALIFEDIRSPLPLAAD